MHNLETIAVELFYQIAQAFFWPIVIVLLATLLLSFFDLGALIYAMWRRRKGSKTDLARLTEGMTIWLDANEQEGAELINRSVSPALGRLWRRAQKQMSQVGHTEDFDFWLAEALRKEQLAAAGKLDRTRMFIRLGPMLGLCGTIIPLGPALRALLGGDLPGMVDHLVIGFGAVVCGLVMSGIAYAVTLIRERWTRAELKDMEDFCDLLMRLLERSNEEKRSEVI